MYVYNIFKNNSIVKIVINNLIDKCTWFFQKYFTHIFQVQWF